MAAALLTRAFSSRPLLVSLPLPRYLFRCSATSSVHKWFSKCSSSDSPPKKPLPAYLRFFVDQHPFYRKQNPDLHYFDIIKKIASAWRELPKSAKEPYETAAKTDTQLYKEQLAKFKAELTLAQEEALKEEKAKKKAKRRALREKRQLTILGKPKKPRNAFNIFMAEHYQEAKGVTPQEKLKHLLDEWSNMSSSQKQTYLQLAQDDRIRYKNEMISWEAHMKETGHEELVRKSSKSQEGKSKKTSENNFVILKESPLGKIVSQAKKKQKGKARELEE